MQRENRRVMLLRACGHLESGTPRGYSGDGVENSDHDRELMTVARLVLDLGSGRVSVPGEYRLGNCE